MAKRIHARGKFEASWGRLVIHLSYSNRSEPLLDALAENVAAGQATLYDPVCLLVPNGYVESYVKQGLARRRGIAAHVEARFLKRFLREVAEASAPGLRIVDRDVIEGELLALFHDGKRLALAELAPVRGYLDPEDGDRNALDRRRAQLAAQLAELFDEYAYSRPEMLAAWKKGGLIAGWDEPLQRWQRELWLALFGRAGTLSGRDTATLPDFFERTPPTSLRVAGPAHVFGISFVARLYRSIFASLARATSLFVYTLNPCRELWEDVQPVRRSSPRRRASSRQLALALGDDAAAARRPRRLSTRIHCWRCGAGPGATAFASTTSCPTATFTSASRIRPPAWRRPRCWPRCSGRSWSVRRAAASPAPRDESLVMFGAPDPRRELETVAAEIWSLVRRDDTLRFDDFAVVVPASSSATYLPLAREVFAAASELPHTVLDLPSAAEGHVLAAVELLLALPSGPLGRPELLQLAMHPTVARRFPDVDPEVFLALCEQLGIVRGADGGDLADSYADDDRVSWDQGLKRLALGAFLSGRRSGEERPFSFDGQAMLAAELPAGAEPAARALGIIARELIDFARTARALIAPVAAVHGAAAAHARRDHPPGQPRGTGGAGRLLRAAGTDRGGRAPRSRGRLRRRRRAGARAPGDGAAPVAHARGRRRRHVRAAARAAVPDRVHARPRRAGVSVGRRGSVRWICARRRRNRGTSPRASRTNTCSSRPCCLRASGCTCRTSAATRRRESARIRRRRCWRFATCWDGARAAKSCSSTSREPTHRSRAIATTPSAR